MVLARHFFNSTVFPKITKKKKKAFFFGFQTPFSWKPDAMKSFYEQIRETPGGIIFAKPMQGYLIF